MNVQEAKLAVAEAGRALLREHLVARTWGNVSCRTGETAFVITPSGIAYEGMSAEDVVEYNMETGQWTGSRKPSSEKGIHAAAYAQFPDAGFVIHTHQTYASALGLTGMNSRQLTGVDRASLGEVSTSEYGLPGTKRLREHVRTALASGAHTVLMAQHGALIVGRDREETFLRAQRLEQVCRTFCRGLPPERTYNAEPLCAVTEAVKKAFPYVGYVAAPSVLEAARTKKGFRAQLDDMAQMIGPTLLVADMTPEAVERALRRHPAVLVAGAGAVCRADTEADCEALKILVEKACVAFLHTKALGVSAALSPVDTALMRMVYQHQYSKKMGG